MTDIPDADLASSAHWEAVRQEKAERFRAHLADMGPKGVAALREYDRRIAELDSGVTAARAILHSISPHQRSVLAKLAAGVPPGVVNTKGPTVRVLVARRLIDSDGSLTEKGRFVLLKGKP